MAETIQLLGAIGEFVGAIAVVATLIYISIQVRHSGELLEANRRMMEENARLARAAAIDRHNDAVSRWRGRLIENPDVADLWRRGVQGDGDFDEVERLRLQNLYIEWINTYRANFTRAQAIGDDGLARQAVLSTAPIIARSRIFQEAWQTGTRAMNELAAAAFVAAVDAELEDQRF